MALNILPIPVSSVSVKHLFLRAKQVNTDWRSRLDPKLVEALDCLHYYWKRKVVDFARAQQAEVEDILEDEDVLVQYQQIIEEEDNLYRADLGLLVNANIEFFEAQPLVRDTHEEQHVREAVQFLMEQYHAGWHVMQYIDTTTVTNTRWQSLYQSFIRAAEKLAGAIKELPVWDHDQSQTGLDRSRTATGLQSQSSPSPSPQF
ncbi:hypothetical protein B0H21DRAFT_828523 [Amylocystis lapponica]|nr:hypothetical protein B0H21DRAFT_828523 [Amylocystis lapponica]